ncbi:MAG: hypothetical protein CVV42_09045 [Candidatus Riflebacteria bacterium HGW-Riflebacteria-2]|nr:MAG: hypothetical protein CVV42_09045 [Candidatus Riflebacteria bacterium HGW-Riflebacteria-2]
MSIERFLQRFTWPVFILLFALTLYMSYNLGSETPSWRGSLAFVPQPEYVARISGTFRPAVAQFFYMRGALEVAGDTTDKIDTLLELFNLALRLDTNLVQAAFLGGVVAPANEEALIKGTAFLEKACELNPNNWRIPYWTGFNHLELKHINKGAEYYWKASLLPGAPRFLRFSAANLPTEGRTLEQSILETEGMLESVEDEDSREWVNLRLIWLQTMLLLEHKAREFKNETLRYPVKLEELVERGLIKEIPKDTFGNGFYLLHPGDPEKGYMIRSY